MTIENKYSEELLEYIKDWAWDSWDCGQSLSCDDLDEFRKLLIENDFNINIEDAQELFDRRCVFSAFLTITHSKTGISSRKCLFLLCNRCNAAHDQLFSVHAKPNLHAGKFHAVHALRIVLI